MGEVADEALGRANFNMAGAAPSIDQNSAERGLTRVFHVEFFERILSLQFIAGLLGVASAGPARNNFGSNQGVFHRPPTVAAGMSSRIGIGDLRGDLHAAVVFQGDVGGRMVA